MTTRRERERQREAWTNVQAADLDEIALSRAAAAGYEPGPDGYMTGRDPRTMTPDELLVMGHERLSPMQAIRAKCLDCCADSPHEVRLCVAMACPSWPYRMGTNPWRAGKTETQREAARRVMEARRLRQSDAGTEGAATTPAAMEV